MGEMIYYGMPLPTSWYIQSKGAAMAIELKDLAGNPETTPFSPLKYLSRAFEEDATKFFNQLVKQSALAKEFGNWSGVEALLETWEQTLTNNLRLPIAFDATLWAPFTKPLS